jgi:hypothetical protein
LQRFPAEKQLFRSFLEVDGQKYLGIYLSKDTATVVCLGSQGRDYNVLDCFSVTVEQQDAGPQALATLLAQTCAERLPTYQDCEIAVALDCSMFMQHKVHSEFTDPKQIAATIRFDTEEALAMDIADITMAFDITSGDEAGSELTVFTAKQKLLSDVLLALQSNNIDPVTMEPDVHCLSRFVSQNVPLPGDQRPFFCLFSRRNGYFIVYPKPQQTPVVRTFLLGPTQDRSSLLTREVPVTAALVEADESINCLKVFDSNNSVDCQQLGEKLGIEAGSLDLAESAGAGPEALADCPDSVDFAVAYGAALSHLEKAQNVNFRNDFSPYQGKKVRMQKTLRSLSVAVVVLVIAVGVYFQMKLLKTNGDRGQMRDNLAKDYSDTMLGQQLPDNPVRKLGNELRRIRDLKSGLLTIKGEESITTKLTMVLEAFNKSAARTDLRIETISITPKTISIVGDTSSRKNTLNLRKAIEQSNLEILQESQELKSGRDNFRITVVPKK